MGHSPKAILHRKSLFGLSSQNATIFSRQDARWSFVPPFRVDSAQIVFRRARVSILPPADPVVFVLEFMVS